jgi:hypothetical protein
VKGKHVMRTVADEFTAPRTNELTDRFDEIVRELRTNARRPGLRLRLGDDAPVLEAREHRIVA